MDDTLRLRLSRARYTISVLILKMFLLLSSSYSSSCIKSVVISRTVFVTFRLVSFRSLRLLITNIGTYPYLSSIFITRHARCSFLLFVIFNTHPSVFGISQFLVSKIPEIKILNLFIHILSYHIIHNYMLCVKEENAINSF